MQCKLIINFRCSDDFTNKLVNKKVVPSMKINNKKTEAIIQENEWSTSFYKLTKSEMVLFKKYRINKLAITDQKEILFWKRTIMGYNYNDSREVSEQYLKNDIKSVFDNNYVIKCLAIPIASRLKNIEFHKTEIFDPYNLN